MKIDNKKAGIILSVIIILSLAISTFYMATKQGFHEDELLTYNLANSSKQLNVDGGWNSPEDFNEYLAVSENDRFDYAQVYENQIIDASHPPFYYALVHTVCSLFPNVFSKWLAYSINVLAMVGILILLFKIGKKVTGNNLYALCSAPDNRTDNRPAPAHRRLPAYLPARQPGTASGCRDPHNGGIRCGYVPVNRNGTGPHWRLCRYRLRCPKGFRPDQRSQP